MDDTLLYQLKDDLQQLFDESTEFNDVTVKIAYGSDDVSYPCVIIREIENTDNTRFYDMQEHVVDVTYQFNILSEGIGFDDATERVLDIMNYIKQYMRGRKYTSLQRIGNVPIQTHPNDTNIKIGYMRYQGCINIDTNTIYRRK